MHRKRLKLYTLDMKYVRDLAKVDDKVMSVSEWSDNVQDAAAERDEQNKSKKER